MIKDRDIIVMGIQPWDIEIGSNCKNIAQEFARYNRVLYVNIPLDRISRIRDRKSARVKKRLEVIRGHMPEIEKAGENLWVLTPRIIIESINWIGQVKAFDFFNRLNTKRFAGSIRKAASSLSFENCILFNDQQMFLGRHIRNWLKPEFYIYYIRDYLVKNPYWKKHGLRLEPEVIRQADLVVTNSELYCEYAKQYNPNSRMIGQGCDTSLYDERRNKIIVPGELKGLQGPVIGYTGFLSHRRLDISLLEYIAKERPQWNLVLIGPEDDVFKSSALHSMGNIFFPGSKKPEELPGYVKGFDVAINPQRLNDATMGNYPRKVDEYLALGKATVVTHTRAMDFFKEVVYMADHPDEFIVAIEKALSEDNEERRNHRISVGCSHTWENSVNLISDSIVEKK
jgi:hypothetical protein